MQVRSAVIEFITEDIIPAQPIYKQQIEELLKTVDHPTKCPQPPILRELREKAKARNLYNFFLPEVGRISVLEYSPIAELLGMFGLANQAMNCSAPDTGNMEVSAGLYALNRAQAHFVGNSFRCPRSRGC